MFSMLGLGLGFSARVEIGMLLTLNACKKDKIEIKTNLKNNFKKTPYITNVQKHGKKHTTKNYN